MMLSGFPLSSLIFWTTCIICQPYKFVIWHARSQSQSILLLQISKNKIIEAYSEVPAGPKQTKHQKKENQQVLHVRFFLFLWSKVVQWFSAAGAYMHREELAQWNYSVSKTCQLERKCV